MGVDPGEYARQLMNNAKEASARTPPSKTAPVAILSAAWQKTIAQVFPFFHVAVPLGRKPSQRSFPSFMWEFCVRRTQLNISLSPLSGGLHLHRTWQADTCTAHAHCLPCFRLSPLL